VGLFKTLKKIGCPPTLLSIVESFHSGMKGTINFDGATSEEFEIKSGVKQGCVLAPTLFGIYFSLLLKHAFRDQEGGIFIHSRSDGGLYNAQRLKAKTKIRRVLIRELLFADDAAITAHSEEELQHLLSAFSNACREFGLTISKKKTQIMVQYANEKPTMVQNANEKPTISIDGEELETVEHFTYLGSTVNNKLSLDQEINIRIGKAATTMSRLSKRIWENGKLTNKTKILVYEACVLSTLLYGGETWSTYSHQEKRLNSFHMRCLRRILGIRWQDKITNTEVQEIAGAKTVHSMLSLRRFRWLGHTCRMKDGRIPKDILYGELQMGKRSRGRPLLRYKDVCKRDMKDTEIEIESWEQDATNRVAWREKIRKGIETKEKMISDRMRTQRLRRHASPRSDNSRLEIPCAYCGRLFMAKIGLASHIRHRHGL
jgi:hypothetical protein